MHKGSVWVMSDKMTDELGFQRKSAGASSEGEASGYVMNAVHKDTKAGDKAINWKFILII